MKKPHFKLKTAAGQVAVKQADLSAHIAVTGRTPWGGMGFGGWLPNPAPVLKKLGKDITVYKELLADPVVGSHVFRRKSAVKAMEWRIIANDAAPVAVELIEDYLSNIDLWRLLSDIQNACFFGYQPLEIIWQTGSQWLPAQIIAKPPEWFCFNAENELLFQSAEQPNGEPLKPLKFLLAQHEAAYTNPYGIGELSKVYWATIFKRGGLKYWMEFLEKFGAPWIIGKAPRSNTARDDDMLLDSLEQLLGNSVAVMPNDSSVDVKEATGKAGSTDAFDKFIRYCRSEIAIALLGQDQTTEKDSTHASAQAGLEVTQDIRDNDCRIIEGCINELIQWICRLNFGDEAECPQFELYEEEQVGKEQAERDQILTNCGVQLSKEYWMRTYKLQEGDIVDAAVTPAPRAADFAEPHHRSDAGMVIDSLPFNAGRLNQQGHNLTDTLISRLQQGSSPEAALEQLINAYPEMDDTALQNELARLIFMAGLIGRIEAREERQ